jgi:glycosyltransferase involved in cell wall biosynthesis
MKKVFMRILPPHSRRRKLVRFIVKKQYSKSGTTTISYKDWIVKMEPGLFIDSFEFKYQPLISIVVPCYNTPEKYLKPLIDSIISQKYENWELCIVNGSTDKDSSRRIQEKRNLDNRIECIDVAENKGIVGNTNEGLKKASGEFVAFVDHDDVLSEYALAEVVAVLNQNKKIDLIYSDEDKLSDDGKERLLPFFKPDWSPELLLGVNYITHFVVARKSIVDQIGGLRPGFDGAQDYDFLLRFTEKINPSNIKHISKILYHWRLADGSTAKDAGEKNYADTAGQRALSDAVKRRKINADVVEIPERPTNYRLRYVLPKRHPKVSIIIPFKDKADLLRQCVGSILSKSTYSNYEIVLLSNNSTEQDTHQYLEELKGEDKCKIFYWDNPFNYSAINNFGVSKSTGTYVILLNNDTEVISPSWIEELIGVASQPGIGAVGPLLWYPTKDIQHAGVVLGMGGMAGHVFRHHKSTDWTDFGMPCWPRNYLAVTGACLAIEKKKYVGTGGLDERFIIAGNDVAFGIKLSEAGYRNVYWPFTELIHYENVSVGSYNNVPSGDYDHSLTYYKRYLDNGDPYFNSNLDLMNEQVGLKG